MTPEVRFWIGAAMVAIPILLFWSLVVALMKASIGWWGVVTVHFALVSVAVMALGASMMTHPEGTP